MNLQKIKLADLKPDPKNTRIHDTHNIDIIKNSLSKFGQYRPFVVQKKGMVIRVGNGMYQAMQELGWTEADAEVKDLTDEEATALSIIDNRSAEVATWDEKLLADILKDMPKDFQALTGFDADEISKMLFENTGEEKHQLSERFVVPPFSVLDTRSGEWQQRKNEWLKLTGDLSETRDGEFGGFGGLDSRSSLMASINEGTSNFDPVMAEIAYKWFCIPSGKILDPFGGEQTKGVVAGHLGYKYHAVEIRPDQVKLNKEKTATYADVHYYTGDSNNISKLITERDFDLCFTSPPYYDLEVYSKEDMSSLGSYEEFMAQYKNIFQQCYDMLADNSFLVVKVGVCAQPDYDRFSPVNPVTLPC